MTWTRAAASACCAGWLLAGTAWALDPHRHVTQFGHNAWRTQEGLVDRSLAVTQTADGYVWFATRDGLVRFDGVRFSRWSPAPGESLPSGGLTYLLGARDGTLWIGTIAGMSRLKNGHLFNYTTTPRSPGISIIVQDRAGTIWLTRFRVNDGMGPLCRVVGDRLSCYGPKNGPDPPYALGLAAQPDGTLWFACRMVCRFAAGAFTSYFEEQLADPAGVGAGDVALDPAGPVYVSFDGVGPRLGVQRYANGKWAPYVVPGFDGSTVRSQKLFVDRQGSLWVAAESAGLYRVHDGHADHYGRSDGLSGDRVASMYEDREGNLWVVTDRGIDMFHDTSVVTYSTIEGLAGGDVGAVLALPDGSVWVGNDGALNAIDGNGVRAIDPGHGLAGKDVAGLLADSSGRLWLGVGSSILTYEGGRFSLIAGLDGRPLQRAETVTAFAEDHIGDIWALSWNFASNQNRLLRIRNRRVVDESPVDAIIKDTRFVGADSQDGVWIAGSYGEFARLRGGKADVVVRLDAAEGPVLGRSLSVDSDGSVWFATNRGLYRWQHGRTSRLDSSNGLPCAGIYSAIRDDAGALWLYAECGLMRIHASDWAAWLKAPDRQVTVDMYDFQDGAQPSTGGNRSQPIASKSPDGRLWFVSTELVQMIDPLRTHVNSVPPPVRIEGIVADGKNYTTAEPTRLPPLPRALEIDYTALSFKSPRRVLFRYKLEGQDAAWLDAGDRRQALYNDLRPGSYRFRVVACNDAGLWNEAGATLDFSIEPAWFQTRWFRAAAAILVLLTGTVLYRMRVRQIAKSMKARFDERLAERTRVARDLHDTLLQTVQGSKLVAHHALKNSSNHGQLVRAMEQLAEWLTQATEEGRAALNSLRTSTSEPNDLEAAFRRALDECRAGSIDVSLSVVGARRELHPVVRDEIYRIGYEAIRNACQHSTGRAVDVRLEYAHDLTLLIRDDGLGIDPAVLEKGKDGHFGLLGMRERAARIGGRFLIDTASRSGTAVTLVVPGRVAFTTVPRSQ